MWLRTLALLGDVDRETVLTHLAQRVGPALLHQATTFRGSLPVPLTSTLTSTPTLTPTSTSTSSLVAPLSTSAAASSRPVEVPANRASADGWTASSPDASSSQCPIDVSTLTLAVHALRTQYGATACNRLATVWNEATVAVVSSTTSTTEVQPTRPAGSTMPTPQWTLRTLRQGYG